jgi:rhamnosyltransferase
MLASIVIRTLNEARHLGELLASIAQQELRDLQYEVVLVDSGSTDETLDIARQHGCHIHHITRERFSFGRSLNIGCQAATGDVLVFISGHCIPVGRNWLQALCQPIIDSKVEYSYGRQLGVDQSFYSERRIFEKYYPKRSQIPQTGFYCNNANSALSRKTWERYRFDEELTGMEDIDFAKRLVRDGGKIGYVAEAGVHHVHNESWKTIKRRFEREAIAIHHIMPEIHVRLWDTIRYIYTSIMLDLGAASRERTLLKNLKGIVLYRFWQYWGTYVGNTNQRELSRAQRETLFYPSSNPDLDQLHDHISHRRALANEGKQ